MQSVCLMQFRSFADAVMLLFSFTLNLRYLYMDRIYCVSLSLTIDMFLLIARIYLISFITNLPIKRTSNVSSVEYKWWKMLMSRQDNKNYGLFLLCVGSRKFKACWKFIFIMIMQRWKMRSLLYFFIFLYYIQHIQHCYNENEYTNTYNVYQWKII